MGITQKQVEVSAIDGISNTITIAEPQSSSSNIVILCLPAMGVPAEKYHALINSFATLGHTAASVDLRGVGLSSVRASRSIDFGYRHLVEVDLPVVLNRLADLFPNKKIVLMGHSLGGQIATLYLTQTLKYIDGLVLVASCSVYYRGWPMPKRWLLLFFTQFAGLIACAVGYFPGRKLGFGGLEARTVMSDWAYNARTGNYRLNGSNNDYRASQKHALELEQFPILNITFADDKFAPSRASEYLLSKLNSSNVSRRLLQREDLGLTSADHFNWLKKPQSVSHTVNLWAKTLASAIK